MSREELGSPVVVGYAKLKLRPDYEDQLVHDEEWLDLEKGGQVVGKICMKIQWIFDQVIFLQNALNNQNETIKNMEE